jgi:hypothetical protein
MHTAWQVLTRAQLRVPLRMRARHEDASEQLAMQPSPQMTSQLDTLAQVAWQSSPQSTRQVDASRHSKLQAAPQTPSQLDTLWHDRSQPASLQVGAQAD